MSNLIDVILVSDAKTSRLARMTEMAILSVGDNSTVIVVESNKDINYQGAETIHPQQAFNYNKYLNLGASHGNSDFIFFGNNDIIFFPKWEENLISAMIRNKVVSASPISPLSSESVPEINSGCHFGYELITTFCGWAFVWRRDFYNKVGGLDEDFIFWCSDNAAIEQLISHKEKHMLVTSSFVQHLGSSTLKYLDRDLLSAYTVKEIEKFNKKFKKNLWESDHLKRISGFSI